VAYEAHATKADGTDVVVLLDKSFNVTAVNAGRGGFGHGMPPGTAGSDNPAAYSGVSL